MDEIDMTPYNEDIKIVKETKRYDHLMPLEAAYWDNELCKTVSSGRIKVRVVRQKEGQYMFKLCNIAIAESGLDRNQGVASLFMSQANNLVSCIESLLKEIEVQKQKQLEMSSDGSTANVPPAAEQDTRSPLKKRTLDEVSDEEDDISDSQTAVVEE